MFCPVCCGNAAETLSESEMARTCTAGMLPAFPITDTTWTDSTIARVCATGMGFACAGSANAGRTSTQVATKMPSRASATKYKGYVLERAICPVNTPNPTII